MNKKDLSIALSRVQLFTDQNIQLEQYTTNCEIAAETLWTAFMNGDINKKTIADLGCGSGMLGIGALLLGAKKVYFVDIDKRALNIVKKNLKQFQLESYELIQSDIATFTTHVDTVIMNPPFGVQHEHADRPFLVTAMNIARIIYSFHKLETKKFIEQFVTEYGFNQQFVMRIKFPLPKTQTFHKKKTHHVAVGLWKFFK